MTQPPRVLMLAGSLRMPSYSHGLLAAIADAIARYEVTPVVWDLRTRPLPMSDPRYHHAEEPYPDPEVVRLRAEAAVAHGFVFTSPIYHNSFSGVLKNALDLFEIAQVGGKAVAVASHGGRRSRQAVDHLRIVARGLRAWTVPSQLCTDRADFATRGGDDPVLTDPLALARVDRLAAELTSIARLLPHIERAVSQV